MNETEMQAHITEHPGHKIYDVRADLARQFACKSAAEFDELGQSLVESGANDYPLPNSEYPQQE